MPIAFVLMKLKDDEPATLERVIQELPESEEARVFSIIGKYALMAVMKSDSVTELQGYLDKYVSAIRDSEYIANMDIIWGHDIEKK